MKFYPVYFSGNESGSLVYMKAPNREEAVKGFALLHQVKVSSYIKTKRPIDKVPRGYINMNNKQWCECSEFPGLHRHASFSGPVKSTPYWETHVGEGVFTRAEDEIRLDRNNDEVK